MKASTAKKSGFVVKCPAHVTAVIEKAARSQLVSKSAYARRAVVDKLAADGFGDAVKSAIEA